MLHMLIVVTGGFVVWAAVTYAVVFFGTLAADPLRVCRRLQLPHRWSAAQTTDTERSLDVDDVIQVEVVHLDSRSWRIWKFAPHLCGDLVHQRRPRLGLR